MSDHQDGGGALSLARLAAILDAYGAEPGRWPAGERAAAEALLAGSPEARAMRDAAARLDRMLAASEAPAPSAALRAAVLEAAPRALRAEPAGMLGELRGLWQALVATLAGELGGLRPAGAALGVALLLGIAAGTIETQSNEAPTIATGQSVDFTQLALFDDPYAGY